MNIAYRCLKCGSDNIQVKVYMNLKDKSIVSDRNDTECYCHGCGEYTDYGFIELDEVLQANRDLLVNGGIK